MTACICLAQAVDEVVWAVNLDILPDIIHARRMTMANPPLKLPQANISCDRALKIAQADAQRVYRDLFLYRISISLEDDGWQVDYELKDPNLNGGGPHYLIDAHSGEIISKRYDQ
jgi:hypothetical protein